MFPAVTFRIVTHWKLRGRREDVARILSEPEGFPRWWGEVYLGVTVVQKGDDRGVGQVVAVHSKGWLPYHLHWQGRLVENAMPGRWVVEAAGDLVGRGVWVLEQVGDICEVSYDWQVRSDRLLFRVLAPAMKRLMVSNHNWAMEKGRVGLQGELEALRSGRGKAHEGEFGAVGGP